MRKSKLTPFMFFANWGRNVYYVLRTGDLYAAGNNSHGQFSVGDKINRFTPVKVPLFQGKTQMEILKVSSGEMHTLFCTTAKRAYSAGGNSYGQIGQKEVSKKNIAKPVKLFDENQRELNIRVKDVETGRFSSFIITIDGKVFSFGRNGSGQLGRRTGNDSPKNSIPGEIPNLPKIEKVVIGDGWVMLFSLSKRIYTCGRNAENQLARESVSENASHSEVIKGRSFREVTFFRDRNVDIVDVSCSYWTSYFFTSTGEVWVCGDNEDGQFGVGNKLGSDEPILSNGLSGMDLPWNACSYGFVVFKRENKVYASGWNRGGSGYSQCGLGLKTGQEVSPTQVFPRDDFQKDVVQIVTGHNSTFLICSNGDVYFTGPGMSGMSMSGKKAFGRNLKFGIFTLVQKGLNLKRTKDTKFNKWREERLLFLNSHSKCLYQKFFFN